MREFSLHVKKCLSKAEKLETKLPDVIFDIHGMSGRMGRIFLNELCSPQWVKYLEIGSWKGSTICSASYDNPGKFVACDNFCELKSFGGTKDDILQNRQMMGGRCNFSFIECECWDLPSRLDDKFNIYFFDGPHDYDSHFRAIIDFYEYLEDSCIIVIDDWNDRSGAVQTATENAIKHCGFCVHFRHSVGHFKEADDWGWWNGFGIYVLEKTTL